MKKILKKISILLLLSVVIGAPANAVLAARFSQLDVDNRGDFVLEPGKMELFLNPGETVTRTISVINRINRPVNFTVTAEDFMGSDSAETPVILLGDQESPYSFKNNLIPELSEFVLQFGEKVELPVTITVPEDAQPGGFYSSVIVSSMPQEGENALDVTGAQIISRIGVLFFIRVNGPVNEEGTLEDFRISTGKTFFQKGPIDFEILFRNTGTVHLVPYGSISVRNMFGKEVGVVPVDGYFSLPKSLRYRQVTLQREKMFGRYTAELTLNRGYDGIEDTAKLSYWVIPWKYILIFILAIFLLASIIYFFRKNFEFKRKG